MTKQDAFSCMDSGQRICHKCYSPDEWLKINSMGLIETNDGDLMGDEYGRFWQTDQEWETGWQIHESSPTTKEHEQFTTIR